MSAKLFAFGLVVSSAGYLALRFLRAQYLSGGEEKESLRLVSAAVRGESLHDDDEPVIDIIDGMAVGGEVRKRNRCRVVNRALAAIRSRLGPMAESPANALVVGREFRRWAGPDGVGMRPSHIAHFEPFVVALYFVPTLADRCARTVRTSDAYLQASRWVPRRSWLNVLRTWGLYSQESPISC